MAKKRVSLIVMLVCIVLVLIGCSSEKISTPPPTKEPPSWKVIKSTNIYDMPDFDSATKGELKVGDILTLPEGVKTRECKTISEPGLTATLCYMRCERLQLEGWILDKWTEEK